MLIIDRGGDKQIRQYWDALPAPSPIKALTESDHQRNILSLLRDSIRKRMMADVPFGVFLSGGVDSSANVALMSELMTQPVRTFTVGFEDCEELNELESARSVSKRFGTDHHEVMIGRQEMQKFLPELVFHQDEPIADPVCVPLYYVSKLARDTGTIVVQVGEGSDEIFAGYDWFPGLSEDRGSFLASCRTRAVRCSSRRRRRRAAPGPESSEEAHGFRAGAAARRKRITLLGRSDCL